MGLFEIRLNARECRILGFGILLLFVAAVLLVRQLSTSRDVPERDIAELRSLSRQLSPTSVSGTGNGPIESVIVEPSELLGKRLPLLDYMDIGSKAQFGDCRLLFVKSDCSDCMEALKSFAQESHEHAPPYSATQYICVDLSPDASLDGFGNGVLFAKLDSRKKWFIGTPLSLELHNGIVRRIELLQPTRLSPKSLSPAPDRNFSEIAQPAANTGTPNAVAVVDDLDNAPTFNAHDLSHHVTRVIHRFRRLCLFENSPAWIRMHSILMFGESGWAARRSNPQLRMVFDSLLTSQSAFGASFVMRSDRPLANRESDFRGEYHRDQFLSYLSLAGVPLDAPLVMDERICQCETSCRRPRQRPA